jgi:hypothetical protein
MWKLGFFFMRPVVSRTNSIDESIPAEIDPLISENCGQLNEKSCVMASR